MIASDDTGEAEQVVQRAESLHDRRHAFCDRFSVRDIDGDAEDAGLGEVFRERCNGGLGGAESGFQVPESEAGCSVFKEGSGC